METRPAVFALAALGALACASVEGIPEPEGSAYATLEEFCRARATAECSAAVVGACQSGSAETCVSLREVACHASMPQGARYVPDHAAACIALSAEVYASASVTAEEARALADRCGRAVFSGPGGVRAPCSEAADCDTAAGLECLGGKCLVPELVQGGMSCAGEADRCAEGSFCDGAARVCVPSQPPGQLCQLGIEGSCQAGSKCVGSGPIPASCQPLAAVGAACHFDSDCAAGLCDRLAASGSGSCVKLLELLPIAASCQGFRP